MDTNIIGTILDERYELQELRGVGGMADIYRARDKRENKTVAVKILKSELAENADFLRKFRNESKAIALLSHRNIVKVFDVGVAANSMQYIVMEYVDGVTLTEYIERQGMLKWREAAGFTVQILRALQHAHDNGIVHRDVKSQNVMLLKDKSIKVMDFGIARFNREIDKTMSEKAIGSVHYISPEQARGEATDEKSDIYSVGIMLYEMLTGKKPFDGDSPLQIAMKHTNEQAKPVRDVNSAIPRGLSEIVAKAMQKEPNKRYKTAGEMVKDLDVIKKNPDAAFEYKYYDGNSQTKYFDKVGNPAAAPARYATGVPDYFDDEDDVPARKSPLLPILFAVASVFVILTALLIFLFLDKSLNPGGVFEAGREIAMPNLQGMRYEDAANAFSSSMYLEAGYENSSAYEKGVIVSQGVEPGKTIKGKPKISVVVSLGAKKIDLPDYANRTLDEVKSDLERMGLKNVVTRYQVSIDIPKDYVVKTDPPAHQMIDEAQQVTIFVSNGTEGENTKVPDFLGKDAGEAQSLAQTYGLKIKTIEAPNADVPVGIVTAQNIPQGADVKYSTEVTLTISNGAPVLKSYQMSISISEAYTGLYTFQCFADGVELPDMKQTIDVGVTRKFDWTVSETQGHKKYSIYIASETTHKRGLCAEYEINFDGDKAQANRNYLDQSIFRKISATEDTVTEAATTAAVTEEEAVFTTPPVFTVES